MDTFINLIPNTKYFLVLSRKLQKSATLLSCNEKISASGVKAEMDELIQSKAVLLISKSYCPYSKKAKQVLVKYKLRTNLKYRNIYELVKS